MALTIYPDDSFDSWASYDEADSYFDGRINTDPWDRVDAIVQERSLKTAFRSMSELTIDLSDIDSADEDVVNALLMALKQAQCEQALHELRHDIDGQRAESISLAGLLSVKLPPDDPPPRYSDRSLAILRQYLYVPTVSRLR